VIDGVTLAGSRFALRPVGDGLIWLEVSRESEDPPLRIDDLRALSPILSEIESEAASGDARALILGTCSSDTVVWGYDPAELSQLDEEELVSWSHEAQVILGRLEELPIPTIAALQGGWIGAGAELALACSYRISSTGPGPRIGFSQIPDNVIPMWGGTVRLPRLVGLRSALRLLMTAELLGSKEALDIGLIDDSLSPRDFARSIEQFALQLLEHGRDRDLTRIPIQRRLLNETAPGRKFVGLRAAWEYRSITEGSAAAKLALSLLLETTGIPPEKALARESGAAGLLATSPEARALMHASSLLKQGQYDHRATLTDPDSAAVIGSGQTGSDIAHFLLTAETSVRLKAPNRESLRGALYRTHRRLDWEEAQGRVASPVAKQRNRRLDAASGYGGFGTIGVLVVAGEESGAPPGELLAEAETHVVDECVIVYHDWSRSPTKVLQSLRDPSRGAALLPQFPLDRFPLVEIASGSMTSPATIDLISRLARRAGVTPIHVSDHTPTPGTRLLGVYISESARLLDEGATISQVDVALEDFGFSVGPFRRMDALGSQRTLRLLETLTGSLGERMRPSPLFTRLARHPETFYRYRLGVPIGPSPRLPGGLSPGGPMVSEMIRRRVVLMLINEAARMLESDPTLRSEDVDRISLLGLGFPKACGGLVYHARQLGLKYLADNLAKAAARYGERFLPAGLDALSPTEPFSEV